MQTQPMRRASFLSLTMALQAAVAAAACSYDRAKPHPLTSRRTQIAHLLRRAGFGASKELLDEYEALGITRAVDRLLDYEQVPDDVEERVGKLGLNLRRLADLQRWWLWRMVYTKRPLQEKMVLFWHGLLVSASSTVGLPNPTPQNPNPPHYMLDQHNFFREHALADFETIVLGISRDPAMLIYLDSRTNNKGKPNENYARELFELFTLGIGNYTETDVREAARAFTGWGILNGKFAFRSNNHDSDSKTVLGKTGPLDGKDVVKLAVEHPAAARYLSRRLFEFFAYPGPSERDLEPLVRAYVASKGSVKVMLHALFTSPAFYSPKAYRALIKSPVELVVGGLRSLSIVTDGNSLPGVTTRMGQALFNPPNVAGWPGGSHWINSSTWLQRVNFCNALLTARNDSRTIVPAVDKMIERHGLKTMEATVEFFGDLVLDGQLSPAMRQALLDYMSDRQATTASPRGVPAAPRALPPPPSRTAFADRKVRGMVYLLMASPEYQLA
ncbi:MAG: DUF1800 domain-containing protein [Chloroflexi bacterium]|nr:DUF1800 domain-containing protein [Chloroflexota bacterium]